MYDIFFQRVGCLIANSIITARQRSCEKVISVLCVCQCVHRERVTITHDALPSMFRDPPPDMFKLVQLGPYWTGTLHPIPSTVHVHKRVVGILLEHFLVKDLSVHAETPVVFLDVVKECLAFPVIVKRHHGATEREEWL